MRIHYLQHVPFEDLANIESWANEKGHSVSVTRMFLNEALPATEQFDLLIIMGGPMNIYEYVKYPWLKTEKEFIREAIDAGKILLGICLGAQLIADVLGGKVTSNNDKEIGWYPVSKTMDAKDSVFFKYLPNEFTAFHWHGDTFEIPPGALQLAESSACKNQAFEYNRKILGLQFHLESSADSVQRLVENCREELADGIYIQNESEILNQKLKLNNLKEYMKTLLDQIENSFSE